jgi:hypothetical protein
MTLEEIARETIKVARFMGDFRLPCRLSACG